jgi:hypothetical protein
MSTNFAASQLLVLVSRQVIGPNRLPVLFAFRLKPNNPRDSGWVLWSGLEDQAYIDDNRNTVVCPLENFPGAPIDEIVDRPIETAWERQDEATPWTEVIGYFGG